MNQFVIIKHKTIVKRVFFNNSIKLGGRAGMQRH